MRRSGTSQVFFPICPPKTLLFIILTKPTGAPYASLDLTEEANLFEVVKEALQRRFVVTASCSKDKALQGKFESIGLLPQYAYTVLACHEVELQGRRDQVLELRNPWGWLSSEWKGRYSRDWFGWTPELRAQLAAAAEGSFLMELGDFESYFASAGICRVQDGYHYVSDTFRHKPEAFSIRRFTVSQPTHCYLSLSQFDKRYFRARLDNEKAGYGYLFGRLVLARRIDSAEIERELEEGGNFTMKVNSGYLKKLSSGFEYEYVDGTSGRGRDLWLEANLDPGEYFALVLMDYAETVYDVTLSLYASSELTLARVDFAKHAGMLDETLGAYAFENIFPMETGIAAPGCKNYKFFARKEGVIVEAFESIEAEQLEIERSYRELHPIFRLARRYSLKEPLEAKLRVTGKRPEFVCVRFTNMDRYNLIGLDKNVLK